MAGPQQDIHQMAFATRMAEGELSALLLVSATFDRARLTAALAEQEEITVDGYQMWTLSGGDEQGGEQEDDAGPSDRMARTFSTDGVLAIVDDSTLAIGHESSVAAVPLRYAW